MKTDNPYVNLEERAFWRTAIANRNMFSIGDLWRPKFEITQNSQVSTYGSCFAQHIGKSLHKRGYKWLITEKPPRGLSDAAAAEMNYGLFSSRTANIYTASLLHQWMSWANGDSAPCDETWESNGRFYDPFRPVRLIPFDPAGQDVVLHCLQIGDVLVLFRPCQPDGKMTDLCPARRSTRVFPMRKRARST